MRSSIETICVVDRVRLAPRDQQHADAAAVAGQRQRRRGADLAGFGALAPGQRTRVVQEIIADARLRGRERPARKPRIPRAYPATIEMSMLRRRAMSSPKPAAKRSRSVPRLQQEDRRWPGSRRSRRRLRRPSRYSSSGDFAYRIASLVAFNAANVRAISVSNVLKLPAATRACPAGFMRAGRLNRRYWRSRSCDSK